MCVWDFLVEKTNVILLNLFSAVALTIFLKLTGQQSGEVVLILICWACLFVVLLAGEYRKAKRKFDRMEGQLEQLDKKYLICELLGEPDSQLEKVYAGMLRDASKAMLDEVNEAEKSQRAYKEYIEEWIHEVKTPITAIELICNNHKTGETKRIWQEVQVMEQLVEQTLYYARSENVEKDYFIKEVKLFELVYPVIMEYRTVFLEKRIQIAVDETDESVYTDEKWVQFILRQILGNAVKYSKEEGGNVRIYSEVSDGRKCLVIEDNGIGIAPDDLERVCEKGFTGRNRTKKKSTGMGLYLVKRLCDRLGLGFRIVSEEGKYTKVYLQFCK